MHITGESLGQAEVYGLRRRATCAAVVEGPPNRIHFAHYGLCTCTARFRRLDACCCCCFQAVVWFYLTWRDERVRQQIADNAAKLANETANYKCEDPCQSNKKAVAGGCCDGEQGV